MKSIPSTYRRSESERGVVVILFAALVLVFFAFAALAIDIGFAASAAHQARSHAQLAALSALERYFFTEGSHETRLAAALERANAVSQLNVVLGSGGSANQIDTVESDLDRPLLVPGRFFHTAPPSGVNPCLGDEELPCFVPYDGSAPVNAMRIQGKYYNDITLRLASVAFGETHAAVNVSATANIVPRHGCFVVDLSRSMTAETHKQTFVYGYYLMSDNPSLVKPEDSTAWGNLSPNYLVRGSNATVPSVHYRDDYQLKAVVSDLSYNALTHSDYHPAPTDNNSAYALGDVEANYRVDMFRNGTIYGGPEPLTTVFAGIDRALEYLQSRAVVGDMACLVFYDDKLSWSRVFKLTSDFDYLRSFTDLSDTADPDHGLLRAIRHGLFPFADAKTNTLLGVAEAVSQLATESATGSPSSDFIVLIGDGITNCAPVDCAINPNFDYDSDGDVDGTDFTTFYPCMAPSICSYSPYNSTRNCPYTAAKCASSDVDGDGVVGMVEYNAFVEDYYDSARCKSLNPQCNNTPEHYYFSYEALRSYIETAVVPANIPVHVMLTGAASGPHTVDIADPDNEGQCLSETEKRALRNSAEEQDNYNTVKTPFAWAPSCYSGWSGSTAITSCSPTEFTTAFITKSPSNPFYQVNVDFYNIATMTGGIWAPIRPQKPEGAASCTPQECRPDLARRTTDPLCRTPNEQMDDYIDEIMGQNPFTLVIPRTDY